MIDRQQHLGRHTCPWIEIRLPEGESGSELLPPHPPIGAMCWRLPLGSAPLLEQLLPRLCCYMETG